MIKHYFSWLDKLIIGCVVSLIFSINFINDVNIQQQKKELKQKTMTSVTKMNMNQACTLQDYFQSKLDTLKYIASYKEIYQMDRKQQKKFLNKKCELLDFYQFFVSDLEGYVYYIDEDLIRDQRGEAFIDRILNNETYIEQPFYGGNSIHVTLSTLIYDHGEKVGALCTSIDMKEIEHFLDSNFSIYEGESYIIDQSGAYLKSDDYIDVYNKKRFFADINEGRELVEKALERKKDIQTTIIYKNEEKLLSAVYLKDIDWMLIELVDTNLIMKDYNTCQNFLYMEKIVGALLLFCVFHIIYRWKVNTKKICVDYLTKCYSRTAFEIEKNKLKKKKNIILVYLDLNHFKKINDTLGHKVGDKVLCLFVKTVKQYTKKIGNLYRIGGDEFIFVTTKKMNIDIDGLFENINKELQVIYNESSGIPISVSYGYVKKEKNQSFEEMIQNADKKMYEYKKKYYTR